ncbi:MAG: hypothetical protein D6695_06100 [Planctomycetota bacterium]|nr:MAG: hypothetical protein D6695_06100 [Planctomycetota bacterium]
MLLVGNAMCLIATAANCPAAQGSTASAQTSPETPARQADLPDAQTSLDAATTLVRWVRKWSVGDDEPSGLSGASVTLRLDGRVIGHGATIESPEKALSAAARRAMLRALPNLPDNWHARADDARQRITVSVELAGPLAPLDAHSDAELALGISPGLEGVAVRIGNRVAARYPLQMVSAREPASTAVRSLVSELSGDATRALAEIDELRSLGYTFYRFRTVQLAQIDPRAAPVFLHRGGRVIDTSELTMPRLRVMADGMASNLIARLWPGVEPFGLMGTMDPVTGRAETRAEHPAAQALVVSALARYVATPGMDAETVRKARQTIHQVLDELAEVADGEYEPWADASTSAAVIVALTDAGQLVPEDEQVHRMRERCVQTVLMGFDPQEQSFPPSLDPSGWGIVSLALVRLSRQDAALVSREHAEAAVRTTFRQTDPRNLVSQFPWLGWAEIELAGADQPIKARVALLEARRLIDEHQLDPSTLAPADRDLAGAIVYTRAATPLPTWNSIRPLPLLADMLADPRLTSGSLGEGEVAREFAHLLGLVRFTHQLCAGPAEGHMFARPDLAMWGVRMALWDPRMPLESTALGLQGVCRTLDAVNAVSARKTQIPKHANPQD